MLGTCLCLVFLTTLRYRETRIPLNHKTISLFRCCVPLMPFPWYFGDVGLLWGGRWQLILPLVLGKDCSASQCARHFVVRKRWVRMARRGTRIHYNSLDDVCWYSLVYTEPTTWNRLKFLVLPHSFFHWPPFPVFPRNAVLLWRGIFLRSSQAHHLLSRCWLAVQGYWGESSC